MAIGSVYLTLLSVACTVAIGNEIINRDVTYEEVLQSTKNPNVLLVDVRRPEELVETGIIPSAINIPLVEFEEAFSSTSSDAFSQKYHRGKPTTDSQIVIYCRSGIRALAALSTALELGYNNAKRYPGSWKEWYEKQKKFQTN